MADRNLIVHIVGDDKSLSRAFKNSTQDAQKFDRTMNQTARGVVAGSGAAKSLGRSLAFASASFLGAASITKVFADSLKEAQEQAVVQRQLQAQFRASGQSLEDYQQQITETTNKLSFLAGFEDDELMAAFTTAFRGTNNVTTALKIQAVAADVARGRNISLQAATIALTKATTGQATALRRLGINIPAALHGTEALNFVQEKFAGQAKAGTTAQDRFAVAIKNTEQIIGTAFLPKINEALTAISLWLSKTENQKKISDGATTAVNFLSDSLHVLKIGFKLAGGEVSPFAFALKAYRKFAEDATKATKDLQGALLGPWPRVPVTGEDVRQRGLSRPGPAAPARGPRASLSYQISLLQERLARAEMTATQRDDRAILVRLAALTKQKIAKEKELGARTALEQTLGSIQKQIQAIDDKAAADRKTAAEKRRDAAEKERREELERYRKTKEQADRLLRQFRENAKKQREALQNAITGVRQEIGALFAGIDPDATKGILGATPIGIGALTKNVRGQTASFRSFIRDIGTLAKRGAPGQLLTELRAGGIEQAQFAHILATSKTGDLRKFFTAFNQREKVVQQIAQADIHARTVNLHVSGARAGATPHAQRSGRGAGQTDGWFSAIGG